MYPASTDSVSAVMKLAASLVRNRMGSAHSAAAPTLCPGQLRSALSNLAGGRRRGYLERNRPASSLRRFLLCLQEVLRHGRSDEPGADSVDADAVFSVVGSGGLGLAYHCVLTRDVRRDAGKADQTGGRGDVDDSAAGGAAFSSATRLRDHDAQLCTQREEESALVHCADAVEIRGRALCERADIAADLSSPAAAPAVSVFSLSRNS